MLYIDVDGGVTSGDEVNQELRIYIVVMVVLGSLTKRLMDAMAVSGLCEPDVSKSTHKDLDGRYIIIPRGRTSYSTVEDVYVVLRVRW